MGGGNAARTEADRSPASVGLPMTEATNRSATHLENRLEFETLISDTSSALFAAPPSQLEQAVERALQRVREFFQADRCALLSVSADQQVVSVRLGSYAEGVPPVSPDLNLAPLFPWSRHRLLVERAPVRVATLDDLPPEAAIERDSWIQLPIRSALTLPIETGGMVRHLIVLNTVHRERQWPDVFVTRLRVFGEMLVIALERQGMFAELREAEERVSFVADSAEEALRRSAARLASGADLAGLAFLEVDYGEHAAYADDRFRDICGVPPERIQGLQTLEFWMERLHPDDRERVLAMRQQLLDGKLDQFSVEYRYLHPAQGQKWIHHLARAPRRDATGRAVVAFGVLRDITERKRSEEELRDLSQRLIRAHEEERALLARELHDDLTQRLAVLAIDVGRAELAVADGAQADAMRSIREGLVRLSEDVHFLAYQLHPSVLEELGLAEALRTECERRGRVSQVDLSVEVEPLPAVVGRDAALCLFRVAQEALNNVARHAGARSATVALRPMDGGLLLAVRDDGAGFDPESVRGRRSLGLASMRERVRLVSGTLDIESAPGQGTSIIAWVPAGEGSK
jgi:PAS domain S-box-containing protein